MKKTLTLAMACSAVFAITPAALASHDGGWSYGGGYFQRRDPAKATKRLVAKLQALGHTDTLQPQAAT